jgi:hypothetical protein
MLRISNFGNPERFAKEKGAKYRVATQMEWKSKGSAG